MFAPSDLQCVRSTVHRQIISHPKSNPENSRAKTTITVGFFGFACCSQWNILKKGRGNYKLLSTLPLWENYLPLAIFPFPNQSINPSINQLTNMEKKVNRTLTQRYDMTAIHAIQALEDTFLAALASVYGTIYQIVYLLLLLENPRTFL